MNESVIVHRPSTAQRLVDALRVSDLRLAVAESLTGGLVSAAVVAVPGASLVLRGSVTAYDVSVKTALLGVDPREIETYGVVSRHIAAAMARGAARLLGADAAVATTGVAGPGSSAGVGAGTAVIAALVGEKIATRRVVLGGGRLAVRHTVGDLALGLLLALVTDTASSTRGNRNGE